MIVSHGELVRKALQHVSDRRKENPSASVEQLLDEASIRYNLSPLDRESLERAFRDAGAAC
ncbi:MAG: hypothetical protein MJ061_04675 [Mailhella sp.]|nr:hypothetical protein [Mailhella sp.]